MRCNYCEKEHDSDYICDEMFGSHAKSVLSLTTAREARLVEALEMAVLTIDRLADQQAMPDDGYLVNVEKISTILAEYRGEK